jgi:hypothetical protein
MAPDAEAIASQTLDLAAGLSDTGCIVVEPGVWSERIGVRLQDQGAGLGWGPARDAHGCAGIVFGGSASAAATLRGETMAPLVLTDQARTQGYLGAASPDGRTFGVCGCLDLTTSAAPTIQAFVHDYQEATGLDPGPYAAEGFDTGALLLGAIGATRQDAAAAIEALSEYDGVAGTYRWDASGALTEPFVRRYVAERVRWIQEDAQG